MRQPQLLQPIGLKIHSFRMGPRGGWYMTFVDGPELAVGRGQVTDKIERFLLVWEKALEVRIDQIERVDRELVESTEKKEKAREQKQFALEQEEPVDWR